MGVKKAVVLAGGLGTRIRQVTKSRIPKALVKIHGRTITEYVIDNLKDMGIEEIYLSIGHHASQIMDYFRDRPNPGIRIEYIVEKEPLGTGGWMNLAAKDDFQDTFMVVNCDDILRMGRKGLEDFYRQHKDNKAGVSIALTGTGDVRGKGVVDIRHNRIIRFVEKPDPTYAPSNIISTGNYLFEPEILSLMPQMKKIMLEKDVFPLLASKGRLYGFDSGHRLCSIGTKEEYDKALQRKIL
ncbi:NTP transferase domain-containing protein [Candidatus Woesearchaeota archaeon]|nr:NTP transferase domain-containing protein [Candidatus Woesearchaeota archaeon]